MGHWWSLGKKKEDGDTITNELLKILDKPTEQSLWEAKRDKEWWEEREKVMMKMLEEYKANK